MARPAIDKCPCCGGPATAGDFVWISETGILTGRGRTVQLTARERQIFDVLWRARTSMYALTTVEIAARAFVGEDGPECELDCVNIFRFKLQQKLRPIGLDIKRVGSSSLENSAGWQGSYRLLEVGAKTQIQNSISTRPESPSMVTYRTRVGQ